jgi:hypothetical protein
VATQEVAVEDHTSVMAKGRLGGGGAVETFWPSYAAGIWRIQHEQWVVPSVRSRRQRQLPRCIWSPRSTPSSASRSEWFQPQCVGLLSALIGTCSMVDSLVPDSIQGMVAGRRAEGVGEKEGGAVIKVVTVEAKLWVETMFISRAEDRGRGRERGRGSHQGGRGGGRTVGGDNVHQSGKEPIRAIANDVQTSEGQAPQMAKPNPEVAQDGKTEAAILQIQKDSSSVGEKRKEPHDHIMTKAVDESGGPEGSKAKDKEKEKRYALLNFFMSFVKVMST